MSKPKQEVPAETPEEKPEVKAESTSPLQVFYFPGLNVKVEATTLDEATNKAKKLARKKEGNK